MKEIAFITQNKSKWMEFEAFGKGSIHIDPDKLSDLYISLVNDLAFAQTYYPKSKTVNYLNQLCANAFQKIYKTKRNKALSIVTFFRIEVPLLMYEYRKYLLFAFLFFGLAICIGLISSIYDDDFVRLILGNGYVEMTLENIRNGDPVAVYGSGSNWGSFLGITFNNLMVSVKCFLYGIFAGIGTVYISMSNGIMLGAFQYFFVKEGVFWASVRGIWIHGAMEIFSIVITTMAGLILGGGILFPGTYSRMDSFKKAFSSGFKIFMSTAPFFFAAGFLEGFVTRFSKQMPEFLSVLIILITLFIISYYYLIYPWKVVRKITAV